VCVSEVDTNYCTTITVVAVGIVLKLADVF